MESAIRGPFSDGFRLIETFGWRPEAGFVRLDAHLARLERTAARLGIGYPRAAVERALAGLGGGGPLRVRLTLAVDGAVEAAAAPLAPGPAVWRLGIAETRLDPDDPWLGVKTTERAVYDRARAALPAGIDEMLFLNRRGEVCEGTILNLFLRVGSGLLTPALRCGLLPGVLRASLIATGEAREAVLTPDDLRRGAVLVGNSLRGLQPAALA